MQTLWSMLLMPLELRMVKTHQTKYRVDFSLTKYLAEGKETRGYDPSQDIIWLRGEIVRWVQGNLMSRWYVYYHTRETPTRETP